MVKHQKGFLDIFLDNSSGLSNSAVEEYKNLIAFHGFLRLGEVSPQDDLVRSSFTCSLKSRTLKRSIILLELSKSPILGTK